MARINNTDAGAFNQSELAEPTRFILAATQRDNRRRCTSSAVTQPTREWRACNAAQ
jgi:hypothetical protein